MIKKIKKLKKELTLFDVYTIATGTTLSAGFFLLPGIASQISGSGIVIAYVLAAIPLIPLMFSILELSTAMPKAGGIYYFLDRSMGPMVGTIGGIGTWLALILKVSFALIGMGAYLSLFIPDLEITMIAIILAFILGLVNILGSKKSSKLQIILVVSLLSIFILFIIRGIPTIEFSRIATMFDHSFSTLIATAGLVSISYVGVTNVASVSEEVQNPERNLPLGIILALVTAIIIYILGTSVMVGVLPMETLEGNLTPAAASAEKIGGYAGLVIMTIAALLAFTSVANAGTMSASRYPLAMSRDHIMPTSLRKLSKFGSPSNSISLTILIIVIVLASTDPTAIAKLASAFQLLMISLVCLAVIIMRESGISSYDSGYKSPLYPWMQILGMIIPFYFISQMGMMPIMFTSLMVIVAFSWYWFYARKKVSRSGAIYHIFEKLGRNRYHGLDSELRGILKEKGLRKNDPFDEIVTRSKVLVIEKETDFESVLKLSAEWFEKIVPMKKEVIYTQIMDGTRIGATPVTHGVALPHFRVNGIEHPEMVLVKALDGINIEVFSPLSHEVEKVEKVKAIFFLVSPEKDPTQHLRILAQIAGRVDDDSFLEDWNKAQDEQELKEALMRDEHFISLTLEKDMKTELMIGKELKDITFPEGCLVTLLRRGSLFIVPKGTTLLSEGDRITIIGIPQSIIHLKEKYR